MIWRTIARYFQRKCTNKRPKFFESFLFLLGERANAVLEMVMTDPDMVLIEVAK